MVTIKRISAVVGGNNPQVYHNEWLELMKVFPYI